MMMVLVQVIGYGMLAVVGLGVIGHFVGEWSARDRLRSNPFDWSEDAKEDDREPERRVA